MSTPKTWASSDVANLQESPDTSRVPENTPLESQSDILGWDIYQRVASTLVSEGDVTPEMFAQSKETLLWILAAIESWDGEAVVRFLNQELDLFFEDAEMPTRVGEALIGFGLPHASFSFFRGAIEQDPAGAAESLNRMSSAFSQAASHMSTEDDPEFQAEYAEYLSLVEDLLKTIETQLANQGGGYNIDMYSAVGYAYEVFLEDTASAIRMFEEGTQVADVNSYLRLGFYWQQEGKLAKAREYYEQWVEVFQDKNCMLGCISVCTLLGDHASALRYIQMMYAYGAMNEESFTIRRNQISPKSIHIEKDISLIASEVLGGATLTILQREDILNQIRTVAQRIVHTDEQVHSMLALVQFAAIDLMDASLARGYLSFLEAQLKRGPDGKAWLLEYFLEHASFSAMKRHQECVVSLAQSFGDEWEIAKGDSTVAKIVQWIPLSPALDRAMPVQYGVPKAEDISVEYYLQSHLWALRQFLLLDGDQDTLEVMESCLALLDVQGDISQESEAQRVVSQRIALDSLVQSFEGLPPLFQQVYAELKELVVGARKEGEFGESAREYIFRQNLYLFMMSDASELRAELRVSEALLYFTHLHLMELGSDDIMDLLAKELSPPLLTQNQNSYLTILLREYPCPAFEEMQLDHILASDMSDPEIIFSLVEYFAILDEDEFSQALGRLENWMLAHPGAKQTADWGYDEELGFLLSTCIHVLVSRSEKNTESYDRSVRAISTALILDGFTEGALEFSKDVHNYNPILLTDIGVNYADAYQEIPKGLELAKFYLWIAWEQFHHAPALLELADIAALEGEWTNMIQYLELAQTLEVPQVELAWVSSLSYLLMSLDDLDDAELEQHPMPIFSDTQKKLLDSAYERFVKLSSSMREALPQDYANRFERYSVMRAYVGQTGVAIPEVEQLLHFRLLVLDFGLDPNILLSYWTTLYRLLVGDPQKAASVLSEHFRLFFGDTLEHEFNGWEQGSVLLKGDILEQEQQILAGNPIRHELAALLEDNIEDCMDFLMNMETVPTVLISEIYTLMGDIFRDAFHDHIEAERWYKEARDALTPPAVGASSSDAVQTATTFGVSRRVQ